MFDAASTLARAPDRRRRSRRWRPSMAVHRPVDGAAARIGRAVRDDSARPSALHLAQVPEKGCPREAEVPDLRKGTKMPADWGSIAASMESQTSQDRRWARGCLARGMQTAHLATPSSRARARWMVPLQHWAAITNGGENCHAREDRVLPRAPPSCRAERLPTRRTTRFPAEGLRGGSPDSPLRVPRQVEWRRFPSDLMKSERAECHTAHSVLRSPYFRARNACIAYPPLP